MAASETDLVQRDPLLRLRLVLQAAFPNDPEIATKWRGRVLRAWRESYGISQSDLAAVGYVTPQAVSNWERGMAGSKSETIQNATSALKHALRLDELHTTALLDTVAASGSIACRHG